MASAASAIFVFLGIPTLLAMLLQSDLIETVTP